MRPVHRVTYARTLHPGAWWLWALALATAASRTRNPIPLLLIMAVTWFVVSARRGNTPWAASYALFFRLAMLVIVIHLVFQVIFAGHGQGSTVLFTLPQWQISETAGLTMGGEVTGEAVLSALYFALQLAAIFCCVGAANALGSARRLVRYAPAALHEIGIAAVIGLTFAPQLVTDAKRVREASLLRTAAAGQPGGLRGRLRHFGRLAMPVLEGSLERSVGLAAAMESRGYGRSTTIDHGSRRLTASLVIGGLLVICLGTYGLLAGSWDDPIGLPTLALGCALAAIGLSIGGRRQGRTRYRPDPWATPEFLVVGCGIAAVVGMLWQMRLDPTLLVLTTEVAVPPVPVVACMGILLAALPAFLAPPLPRDRR